MRSILRIISHAPISKKLMYVSMFITSLTLLMMCIIFVSYDITLVKKALADELVLISDVIGKRTAPALEFMGNNEQATKNLQDLTSKQSVLYACISTISNEVVAEYGNKKHPCQITSKAERYIGRDNLLYIHRNIVSVSGKIVGTIFLISDLRDIGAHLQKIASWVIYFALTVFFVTYYCAQKLNNLIVRPIMELNEAAAEISRGNYNIHVPEISQDEIGVLTRTFNTMTNNARNYKDHLERTVEERTHDLEVAVEKAEAANEAKTEFLRNMSHEFRTPLHGMINLANFGINDAEDEDRTVLKVYFEKIAKVTARLTELVDGILNISRMENGTEEFMMAQCDVGEMLDIVAAEQQVLFQQKGINLIYNKPDFDTKIVCHRGKIIQVITNLVGNAVKFTPAGKNITLSAIRRTNEVYISVSDEGIGIPVDELEAVFEKFVQSTRTKTGAGGTGLGLAICKGIVGGHGGRIWAEANPDVGTTFIFTIPLDISVGSKIVKFD